MNINYNIIIAELTKTKYFSVSSDEEYAVLENFTSHDWTPSKAQEIIDGIDQSRTKEYGQDYKWQNEDVLVISNKHGVFFIDLLAQRAGQKSEKQDLDLTHDEFITFMQDFKEFIEENQ